MGFNSAFKGLMM